MAPALLQSGSKAPGLPIDTAACVRYLFVVFCVCNSGQDREGQRASGGSNGRKARSESGATTSAENTKGGFARSGSLVALRSQGADVRAGQACE
jgi:hypothetical protein